MATLALVALLATLGLQEASAASDPARWFDYDSSAPLALESGPVESIEGVNVQEISYASPKGGRVSGYLVAPPGTGPFAGIVFMHWGQGDRTEFLSEAVLFARAGAVSLMIDAPYNRPEGKPFAFVAQPEIERDSYVQLVIDLRRGVDLLVARPDVDRERIGYVGHSLGATWGGALAGLEKRVAAYVLMGGLPSLTDVLGDDRYARLLQSLFSREQLEKYVEVLSPLNPEHLVGRAAPGSIFFQFASHDRFISEKAAAAYAKAAGPSHELRWYFTSHEFNDPRSSGDRFEWLKKKLRLTEPRDAKGRERSAP
jgi:dienelactone hydrolase